MKTVAISYGWSEGPWHGRALRRELLAAGFSMVRKLEEADVIIAHSGGCFMLPDESRADLVLLVGLPYWPGRHPLRSLKHKLREEIKNAWWLRKTVFNAFYFLTRPRRWFLMWRAWKAFALPAAIKSSSVITVRNDRDHFMHPTETEALAGERGWELTNLAGTHDDLWLHPEPYVKLIKKIHDQA